MQTIRTVGCISVMVLSLYFSQSSIAGQLDDFESAATTERSQQSSQRTEHTESSDDDDSICADLMLDLIGEIFSFGEELSLARVNGSTEPLFSNTERRVIGSPDLPFIRLDLGYQNATSDTDAFDGRLEVGYGPYAFEYRKTHFRENFPQDEMDLEYFRGLYRVSGSQSFEFNLGIGAIVLEGNDRYDGLSTIVPINIYPHPNFGLRVAPSWSWINGNPINDVDGSVAYIQQYFSIRAGYRRIQSSNEILHGPYAGISFHY